MSVRKIYSETPACRRMLQRAGKRFKRMILTQIASVYVTITTSVSGSVCRYLFYNKAITKRKL
jgi:hypothetical protein